MQQLFPYFRALFMYQRQGFRTYFLILTVMFLENPQLTLDPQGFILRPNQFLLFIFV